MGSAPGWGVVRVGDHGIGEADLRSSKLAASFLNPCRSTPAAALANSSLPELHEQRRLVLRFLRITPIVRLLCDMVRKRGLHS